MSSRRATEVVTRPRQGRVVAGVCRGLAEHLGVEVRWVRLAFVLALVVDGLGALVYAAFWVVLRQRDTAGDRAGTRNRLAEAAASAGVGVAVLAVLAGIWSVRWWPLAVVAAGASLVWQTADDPSSLLADDSRGAGLRRLLGGSLLVLSGVVIMLAGSVDVRDLGSTVAAVLASLAGVALVTAPWWVRLLRQLDSERAERVRATERAEIAAHLHDSVLQTLALIQQASSDPRQVVRLARTQERELRGWLYERPTEPAQLQTALAAAAAEVEQTHGIPVDVVAVGDTDLDPRLAALVRAVREAAGNAARHSGADAVSVYAEVEPDQVSVFVRDRGHGFDPDAVPADRLGLRESVLGRVSRHGGRARVRSSAESGTEVALTMPLAGTDRTPERAPAPPGASTIDQPSQPEDAVPASLPQDEPPPGVPIQAAPIQGAPSQEAPSGDAPSRDAPAGRP